MSITPIAEYKNISVKFSTGGWHAGEGADRWYTKPALLLRNSIGDSIVVRIKKRNTQEAVLRKAFRAARILDARAARHAELVRVGRQVATRLME